MGKWILRKLWVLFGDDYIFFLIKIEARGGIRMKAAEPEKLRGNKATELFHMDSRREVQKQCHLLLAILL